MHGVRRADERAIRVVAHLLNGGRARDHTEAVVPADEAAGRRSAGRRAEHYLARAHAEVRPGQPRMAMKPHPVDVELERAASVARDDREVDPAPELDRELRR